MFTFFFKEQRIKNIKETLILFFNFKFQNQLEKPQDTPSGGPCIYGVHLIK